MKKITKREITEVIRTCDQTQVFRLYLKLNPTQRKLNGRLLRYAVAEFIENYAPTKKTLRWANEVRCYRRFDFDYQNYENKFYSRIHDIVEFTKLQVKNPYSPYAKRPMLGSTHLYFCSPVYGLSDYNKWCALPIKYNARFCEAIIKYADKYFNKIKYENN